MLDELVACMEIHKKISSIFLKKILFSAPYLSCSLFAVPLLYMAIVSIISYFHKGLLGGLWINVHLVVFALLAIFAMHVRVRMVFKRLYEEHLGVFAILNNRYKAIRFILFSEELKQRNLCNKNFLDTAIKQVTIKARSKLSWITSLREIDYIFLGLLTVILITVLKPVIAIMLFLLGLILLIFFAPNILLSLKLWEIREFLDEVRDTLE